MNDSSKLDRAQLLKLGAVTALLPAAARLAPSAARAATGPIVKPLPPEWFVPFGTNAEMRWDAVDFGHVTPNERFFVRNHTSTPVIDASTWRLQVFGDGLRGGGISLGYEELRRLPSRTITAAIECAGNGRSFFASQQATPATGTQWTLGAIGVATWRGVLLSEVLERARIRNDAVDVLPQGLDANFVSGGVDYGRVRRPLPVSKALDDVLLAYEMNGEPLPPDHGFPVRLVVPGWIGIASIKWLGQLEVSRQPLVSPVEHALVSPDGRRLPGRLAADHVTDGQVRPRAGARRRARLRPLARLGTGLVGDEPDPPGRDQRRRRIELAPRASAPELEGRLDAVDVRAPASRGRPARAVGARGGQGRPNPAAHRPVQRQRLPLRRRRATPDRSATGLIR